MMAISQFLGRTPVFTSNEFEVMFPNSQTDRNLLSRAVASGKVDKVRRGVYVSRTGRFEGSPVDPLQVAAASTDDCTFCLLTALQVHGVLHNLVFRNQFYTERRMMPFTYAGVDYQPIKVDLSTVAARERSNAQGRRVRVSTREQTILDCLDSPSVAGGTENVLRSVSGFNLVDIDALISLTSARSAASAARVGWLAESLAEPWHVTQSQLGRLHDLASGATAYFGSGTRVGADRWINNWRLYLPAPRDEVASWLNPRL
ncbi:MAG: hypothetical protein LBH13_00900 [Cellulomonadaceae bacterium]|jgi:predicted transcriptional regulator of viral defense system|nr:hypothetical protein [Cellulomonadaceae bacterium]